MGRRNFLIILSYEGSGFSGWQRLGDGSRTVQGVVEDCLRTLLGEPSLELTGAGRTDRGVHAEGQAASFHSRTGNDCATIARTLDAALPDDVSCLSCREVDPRFHARFRARSKLYRYRLDAATISAGIRSGLPGAPERGARGSGAVDCRARGPGTLDLEAMRFAASLLVGERDFRFLSNDREKADALRRVDSIRVEPRLAPGEEWIDLLFEGPAFLRNQVRIMAALILAAGSGAFGAGQEGREAVARAVASGERSRMPGALPAGGLCLMEVRYSGYGFDERSSASSTRRANSAR